MLRSDAEHSGSQLLLEADGVRIGELIRSGDLDPLEILQAAIDGLTELGSTLSVLDSERFAAALVDVGGRDDLPGVFGATPILVKDLIDYPDLPFRSGSRMLAGNVSQWRSPYIERLEAAGLVVLGKSTTPEFGLSVTTESLLNGPTRNPWDHTLSPGGSSGGSSAAVASRLVPIAHANDAGGSIRIPASLCGVFGLKPSRGRMVSARQNGLAADIAVEHAVTNTVRDSARVFAATEQSGEGADFAPVGFVTGSSGQRLRIGLLETGMYGDSPEPEVAASIRATASILEGLGHVVEPTAWPTSGDEVISHFLTIWSAGAAFVANLYLEQAGVPPDPTVLEPFTLGMANRFVSRDQGELPAAQQYVDDLNTASSPWFDEYDVLLSPVTSRARLPLGEFAPDTPFDSLLSSIIEFADYTPLHNMAGTPAMSVPVGTTDDGLPIGSHFAAKKGDEGRLFELAYELEAAAPWIDRHPVR